MPTEKGRPEGMNWLVGNTSLVLCILSNLFGAGTLPLFLGPQLGRELGPEILRLKHRAQFNPG
ncbi:hypothetical protein SAMN03097708_01830 [Thiohalomonas denitrificans]|uniref:Uncharacterized protein n=1 Tax=Thiohalomonas denitrificans TaxID=415747 RepID=A0A1G5QC95_9GAMM|nr:hypothetical protein SAMN03097708_01830 [Thiohalomonas denitrificans]